jgi:hypothetical protein
MILHTTARRRSVCGGTFLNKWYSPVAYHCVMKAYREKSTYIFIFQQNLIVERRLWVSQSQSIYVVSK